MASVLFFSLLKIFPRQMGVAEGEEVANWRRSHASLFWSDFERETSVPGLFWKSKLFNHVFFFFSCKYVILGINSVEKLTTDKQFSFANVLFFFFEKMCSYIYCFQNR